MFYVHRCRQIFIRPRCQHALSRNNCPHGGLGRIAHVAEEVAEGLRSERCCQLRQLIQASLRFACVKGGGCSCCCHQPRCKLALLLDTRQQRECSRHEPSPVSSSVLLARLAMAGSAPPVQDAAFPRVLEYFVMPWSFVFCLPSLDLMRSTPQTTPISPHPLLRL